MNNYCYTYPICPNCHQPLVLSSNLHKFELEELCLNCNPCVGDVGCCELGIYDLKIKEKENRKQKDFNEKDKTLLYKCQDCGSYYFNLIDFRKFPVTSEMLLDKTENIKLSDYFLRIIQNNDNENIINIPVIWDSINNIIEQSYLSWLNDDVEGKYVITWPWNEVKFIPLLISEFALNFPNKRIVVLDDFYESDMEDNIRSNISLALDYLFFYELNNAELDNSTKKEMKSFNKKLKNHLLSKSRKVHIFKKYLDSFNAEEAHESMDYIDFKNHHPKWTAGKIKDKFNKDYGEGSVGKVFYFKDKPSKLKAPENPKFDIYLRYQTEWGGKPKFKAENYWKVLNNLDSMKQVKNHVKYVDINNTEVNPMNLDNHIFFIPSNNYKINMFKTIEDINPDLLIIPDADNLVKRYRMHDPQTTRFIYFLKNFKKTALMFSTEKIYRHDYQKFNKKELKGDLIFHTWDSDEVLNEIIKNNNFKRYSFSLFSSEFPPKNKANLKPKNIKVNHICAESLDELENFLQTFYNKISETYDIKYFKRFCVKLLSTPLFIYHEDPNLNFNIYDDTFKGLVNQITNELKYETSDEKLFEKFIYPELVSHFDKIYLRKHEEEIDEDGLPIPPYDEALNPLMDEIIKLILELLERDPNSEIYFIARNKYYARNIRSAMGLSLEENILNKINIVTWKNIKELDLKYNSNIYAIATDYPDTDFDLYNSSIKNYYFIGTSSKLHKIKEVVENKIAEKIVRPIIPLNNEKNAPDLLNNTLNILSDDINKLVPLVDEYYEDIIIDKEFKFSMDSFSTETGDSFNISKIREGEKIALAINENGEGLFIPLNRTLTIANDNNSMELLKLKDSNSEELINNRLMLNRNGFYTSYKVLFTRFMVENMAHNPIKTPNKTYENFKELLDSAHKWLRVLRYLVEIKEKQVLPTNLTAKESIAMRLYRYGDLTVSRENVQHVWLSDPMEIETSQGTIEIFEIDRPQNPNNIVKIYECLSKYPEKFNIVDKNIVEEYDLTLESAKKTFEAAKYYQELRRNFFREKNIKPEHQRLYQKFHIELYNTLKTSDFFKVTSVKNVILTKDVQPFKVIDNYYDYFK